VDARALYRKITWRLIPYLFLLYIVAYVDRVNVGFAAMDMKRQLAFGDTVYGTGAGIFFIGYALFGVPSNLLIQRVGTRRLISGIMISWGIIATMMMFVQSVHSFYLVRFLLGVSEAGFFPGMMYYLTFWFPSSERGRAVAKFMTATSIAGVVGGPVSSVLLKLDGVAGLHGWQWLFAAEGIPTVLLGISVLFVLKDGPGHAGWLQPEETRWLADELSRDRTSYGANERSTFGDAIRMPAVWVMAGIYLATQIGIYIVNLWMPLILDSAGKGAYNSVHIARYAAVPYLLAAIFTVAVGWSSDRTNERRGHLAGCLALAAAGFAWAAVAHSFLIAFSAMSLVAIGMWSSMGPFWALMTRAVTGTAAATGVAIVIGGGGLGGFIGPYVTGRLREATDSFARGLYAVSLLSLAAALVSLAVRARANTNQ